MKKMPTIKAVMTAFPYSVDAGASVADALLFMQKHRIRHLPVTQGSDQGSNQGSDQGSKLVGSVSDRDIRLILGPDFANPDEHETLVADAMMKDAYVVDMDARLDEVLTHMAEHHLGSAIVTRRGKLAGIFTVTDACRHFADFLREQVRRAGGDDAA